MSFEYKVEAFFPVINGCGATDKGWDQERRVQFQKFLNGHASDNWKLHSCEYREMKSSGCGNSKGTCLVCIFERPL